MHEIGTWSSPAGTVEATLDVESGVHAQELPRWVSGALKGALAGAATGAAAGPYGALVGAAAGGALGAASTAPAPPPAKKPRAPAAGAPPAPPKTAPPAPPAQTGAQRPPSATDAALATALQQLAALLPALLAAAGSGAAKTEMDEMSELDLEGASTDAWFGESIAGEWTVP